nr:elongation factor 1-delta-like [Ipomoea batatas]
MRASTLISSARLEASATISLDRLDASAAISLDRLDASKTTSDSLAEPPIVSSCERLAASLVNSCDRFAASSAKLRAFSQKSIVGCESSLDLSQYLEMAVTFYNLNSDAGVKKLDEYLLTRSYISGYQASKDDITVYSSLPKPPSSEYVNASRWYKHIDALLRISGVSGEGCGVIIEGSAPIPAGVATPPAADTKETEEEKKAAEERAAAVKASSKKKESGKSSVLMDVKPWDDETDMKKLEEAVRSVTMEGLLWGASKLVPVGYGIKKLQIMLTIVDDLVSVDELIESTLTVEPVNEYVQSCDIVAFNKILFLVSVFLEVS